MFYIIVAPISAYATVNESRSTIIYNNKPQPLSIQTGIESITNSGHYKISEPIKLDILLDEKIGLTDPRVKSLSYVAHQNNLNFVKIIYTNPQAETFANNFALLLNGLGLKVKKPEIAKADNLNDLRVIMVYVNCFISMKYHNESTLQVSKLNK